MTRRAGLHMLCRLLPPGNTSLPAATGRHTGSRPKRPPRGACAGRLGTRRTLPTSAAPAVQRRQPVRGGLSTAMEGVLGGPGGFDAGSSIAPPSLAASLGCSGAPRAAGRSFPAAAGAATWSPSCVRAGRRWRWVLPLPSKAHLIDRVVLWDLKGVNCLFQRAGTPGNRRGFVRGKSDTREGKRR